ncbi:hypothetical protein U27_05836 [Candidatus Vecturithrix granuli]|uniref:Uncharacterized protein n=1 Tax=Vecturithrix granuli TaxID=1499967 RepID=A0A081C2Q6_VECG1|nr:hypothetical protein U27_05836 [Candidatus Vecturithrix granuli]
MKNPGYQLIFQGVIAPGQELEEVRRKLSARFHIDAAQLDRLFNGKPIIVKEDADYKTVLKYQILFEWAGAIGRIESKTPDIEPDDLQAYPSHVNVIFDGAIEQRYRVEDVKKNLKDLLKLNDRRLEELFSGHPVLIMQNVNYLPALKIQTSFELAGAMCRIEPVEQASSEESSAEESQQEQSGQVSYETMHCPKCGREQKKSRKCRYCGIYIETYLKKNTDSTSKSRKQSAFKSTLNLKRELSQWGTGLIVLGIIQFTGLGVWASALVLIGILNLLVQQRVMFLVNGVTLLISGTAGFVFMILHTVFMKQDVVVQAGNGGTQWFIELGYIVIISGIQFYLGARAFKKFVSYRRA